MNSATLVRWLVLMLAVFLAAHIIPGINYDSFTSLIVATLVLAVLNAILKPLLTLLSLPFILLTLGLFLLVINAVLLLLTHLIVPGFHVSGFWSAMGGSLIISLVNMFLGTGPRTTTIRTRKAPRPRKDDQDRRPPPGKGPVIDI